MLFYNFLNHKVTFRLVIFFKIIFFCPILCQEIPSEFYDYKKYKFLLDSGENWNLFSTLGSARYHRLKNYTKNHGDSTYFIGRYGFETNNKNFSYFGYGHLSFKENFYIYLHSRIVSNASEFERYTGIPRGIARAGFNSGETDLAGVGYENDFLIFQIGRGRQNWSAGNDIPLVLSDYAPAYDYHMLGFDLGMFKLLYFNGFLESDTLLTNRYISARGIEWRKSKYFLISLSEIVIYSGRNRPMDYSYLNPVSSHLEIELNNKQNFHGTGHGNGIWQLSIDWMLLNRLRISTNLGVDEFVLDHYQKRKVKIVVLLYLKK